MITATPAEGAPLPEAWVPAPDSTPDRLSGTIRSTRIHLRALGVGKANTAAGLTRAILELAPAAVIQIGIGGTYAGSFLPVGGVAIADDDWDLDFGVSYAAGWEGAEQLGFGLLPEPVGGGAGNRLPTDPELTRWLSQEGRIPVVTFGTSDSVSGDLTVASERRERFDLSVESMEGAAAAQTAARLGVPFAQVRGISNVAGQRDKASWEIRTAIRVAVDVLVSALRNPR